MTKNYELARIWKEIIVTYFKVLSDIHLDRMPRINPKSVKTASNQIEDRIVNITKTNLERYMQPKNLKCGNKTSGSGVCHLIFIMVCTYICYIFLNLASYSIAAMNPFPGLMRPRSEADRLPPSSGKVKNAWSYTSTPSIRLHGVILS
jgi:hypothetical protein